MTQKNIVLYAILTVVTCGLFGIYWIYTVADDMSKTETSHNLPTTPGLTLLLCIVTCGIYSIYAYYQWGKAMQEVQRSKGLPDEDKSVLYLVLALLGLAIIDLIMLQNDINQLAEVQ